MKDKACSITLKKYKQNTPNLKYQNAQENSNVHNFAKTDVKFERGRIFARFDQQENAVHRKEALKIGIEDCDRLHWLANKFVDRYAGFLKNNFWKFAINIQWT